MKLFVILGLCALGAAAFASGLSHPFVFDDKLVIAENSWLTFKFLPNFFRSFISDSSLSFPGYRPLVMASFALQNEWTGIQPFSFKLFNFLCHVSVSFLVYLLALGIFTKSGLRCPVWAACFAAALFLLHPIQTNVIFLAWKRTDLFVSIGILGTFLCAQRWMENEKKNICWLLGAWVCAVGAALSKESALILPAVIAVGDFLIWNKTFVSTKRRFLLYVPLITISALHAWVVFMQLPPTLAAAGVRLQAFTPPSLSLSPFHYFFTQSRSLLLYVSLLFFPTRLAIFHWIEPIRSLGSITFWGVAFGVVALFFTAIRIRKKVPVVSFCILWFLILLIPSSSFVPLHFVVDEDRLYLPLAAFAICFAFFIDRLMEIALARRRAIGIAVAATAITVLVLYAVQDNLRAKDWRSELSLFSRNAQDEPKDPRAWVALANAWATQGDERRASGCYSKALALEPDYGFVHFFWAQTLFMFQELEDSKSEFEKAFRMGVLPHDTLSSLGLIALHQENPGESARYFAMALHLIPFDSPTLRNFSKLLEGTEQKEAALEAVQIAATLKPKDKENQARLSYMLNLIQPSPAVTRPSP